MLFPIAILINLFLLQNILADQYRVDYMWANAFDTYYKLHDLAAPWNKARQTCEAEGTTLLLPNSIEEIESLKILVSNMKAHYTAIFIGLHDQFSEGQFVNLKGSPIADTHLDLLWAEGRPDNLNGSEHCVTMNREGLFDDKPCDDIYPFVCKIFKNHTKYNAECKNYDLGYFSYPNGKCYKFHGDPLSWHEAYMVCNAEEGRLAIINSPKEASLITSFLGKYLNSKAPNPNILFIGFSDLMFLYQYRTILGQTLIEAGYSRWNSLEDNSKYNSGNVNCGVISRTGHLDVMNCYTPAMFLCEKIINETSITNK